MAKITFQEIYQRTLDIVTFTAVGHLCGRVVQQLDWKNLVSVFDRNSSELNSLTACCALFIVIDRFAQRLLSSCLKEFYAYDTLTAGLRMAASATGAIVGFNQLTRFIDFPKVEFKVAATVIGLSVVVYTLFYTCINIHRQRGNDLGYRAPDRRHMYEIG